MKFDLTNEVALISGASRGIGQGIAFALGQAGATIIGTATTEAGTEKITQALQAQNIQGEGRILNLAEKDSIDNLMQNLQTMPTILVNNAAITKDNLLVRMKDEDWLAVIHTNLSGVYYLTKACLRAMTKAKHGRIITITSVVGFTGNPGQANYAAAKAGVIGFSKSLAREVGSRSITVNAIAPGFIATDMTANLPEAHQTTLLQQIPLNRAGTTEDVAAAALFLSSQAASYITGETIHVNGGMYMA